MRSQDSWCCFLLPALPFWTTWASRYAVYPYAMYHGVTATCLHQVDSKKSKRIAAPQELRDYSTGLHAKCGITHHVRFPLHHPF